MLKYLLLSFPLYLLVNGKLTAYLALAKSAQQKSS